MARKEDMNKVSFRISASEKEMLVKYAEENDLTVSQIVRRAVKKYLNERVEE